ncbi:MarR family winged helix-turn-helix transcriptional regulator [Streptomyces sp. BI20]|uniref:MarR family winged helix-turn-helix transcriptional regulator n=1 Tax=Streptomyces sp. BI20 TaxID=3403460 RepID=UPI003C7936D3
MDQEPPTPPVTAAALAPDRLGLVIKRAEQALIARKTRALRAHSLTVPQYAALLLLAASDGMSAAQLARECMVTPQTMSTVLGNLEKAGHVVRAPSPLHQRVLVVRATDSGRALVRRADEAALAVERRLGDAFTPEERAALEEYLERAVVALTEEP